MNTQEIRERCNKATPGPWDYDCGDNSIYSMTCFGDGGYHQPVSSLFEEKSIILDDDADFIARAREDLPVVLDEVERLTDKLAAYEQAERDGLLVRLPCRIGDTVWAIRNYQGKKHAQKGIVSDMFYREDMEVVILVKHIARGVFGETVFLTREEAEAALS